MNMTLKKWYTQHIVNKSGTALVYAWDGSTWNQLGDLFEGENAGDQLGNNIKVNNEGNIVAILAPFGNDRVQVHKYNGLVWERMGGDIVENAAASDGTISYIRLNGDGTIVAVAWRDANGVDGIVRLYRYDGTDWLQVGEDMRGDIDSIKFGRVLALSDDGYTIVAVTKTGEEVNAFRYNITAEPTASPTLQPSTSPSGAPTVAPTLSPSQSPSADPTRDPTNDPTLQPTEDPSSDPTSDPTIVPS